MRSTNGTNARFGGVVQCKAVWTCPVCAARIANVRREELEAAVLAWHGLDDANRVYLLTLTFPHEAGADLALMLGQFARALGMFKRSKIYDRVMSKERRQGSVRSLESTIGEHGWHPHTHDLVFAKAGLFAGHRIDERGRILHADIDRLKGKWALCLVKHGLCDARKISDVLEHGLDVRGGDYAAEYIAKFGREQRWGLSREATMHVAKTGSDNKGAHPFQLLEWAEAGDGRAHEQFREYAAAFRGKRMLAWSRGLRALLLGADEIDDADLDEKLPDEECIGTVTREQLSMLIARRSMQAFLVYVATCCSKETGQDDIEEWFARERTLDRKGQGTIKQKLNRVGGFAYADAELESSSSQ